MLLLLWPRWPALPTQRCPFCAARGRGSPLLVDGRREELGLDEEVVEVEVEMEVVILSLPCALQVLRVLIGIKGTRESSTSRPSTNPESCRFFRWARRGSCGGDDSDLDRMDRW